MTDDEVIVFYLLQDLDFKDSIQFDFGPLKSMYVDWSRRTLIYEFKNGTAKESDLDPILNQLKSENYIGYWRN